MSTQLNNNAVYTENHPPVVPILPFAFSNSQHGHTFNAICTLGAKMGGHWKGALAIEWYDRDKHPIRHTISR